MTKQAHHTLACVDWTADGALSVQPLGRSSGLMVGFWQWLHNQLNVDL